jgi:hypothetical protein
VTFPVLSTAKKQEHWRGRNPGPIYPGAEAGFTMLVIAQEAVLALAFGGDGFGYLQKRATGV